MNVCFADNYEECNTYNYTTTDVEEACQPAVKRRKTAAVHKDFVMFSDGQYNNFHFWYSFSVSFSYA